MGHKKWKFLFCTQIMHLQDIQTSKQDVLSYLQYGYNYVGVRSLSNFQRLRFWISKIKKYCRYFNKKRREKMSQNITWKNNNALIVAFVALPCKILLRNASCTARLKYAVCYFQLGSFKSTAAVKVELHNDSHQNTLISSKMSIKHRCFRGIKHGVGRL